MSALRQGHLLPSALRSSHPRLIGGGGARRGPSYTDAITLGRPGRCAEDPLLLITLFDNSGSITGGNDPVGQRFVEAGLAVSAVGRRCRCGDDLVAVLHFDTPTSGDLAPTSIRDARALEASLAVPPDGAGISSMAASLDKAYALAARHPRHRAALVALTDFELFDPPGTIGRFLAFPGDVHAVTLRSRPPQLLLDAPDVAVTPVSHDSRPGALARAIFTALTAGRPGARPIPAIPQLTHP